MFKPDISSHSDALTAAISGKSILVIGGAGSIGSSFVKAILPFKPKTLVVVDINENALAEQTRPETFAPPKACTFRMNLSHTLWTTLRHLSST